MTQSLQALEVAASRYMDSKDCVGQIKKSYEGVETLIPLTSSLFVPATLENTDTVLVDIGANYYATKVFFPLHMLLLFSYCNFISSFLCLYL